MAKIIMIVCGLSGGLAVILGAFAAHGLKKRLSPEMLSAFKTGVDYQFYHTFALALVGLSILAQGFLPQGLLTQGLDESTYLNWAFICFIVGITLFSGSLYLLALTQKKIFGPITPLGGLFFIAGWLFFTLHWLN